MELEAARRIYEARLRALLEPAEIGRFVAIEPESGDYFLADDFGDALQAGLARYPDRRFGLLRVGGGGVIRVGSPRLQWDH